MHIIIIKNNNKNNNIHPEIKKFNILQCLCYLKNFVKSILLLV